MLSSIKYLSLRHKNISSLVGIGLFSSLSVLDISENHISDLSPLADCENLTVLNMSGNPTSDLSPLSTLPLASLDVSYSGFYNFNQLVSVGTLSELILADTLNGRYGTIRPDDSTVAAWLQDLNLLGCNEPILVYEYNGNTYKTHVVEIGGGCPQHGSCVNGKCECNDGYIYYPESNSCFNPNNCGYRHHPDMDSGSCVSNTGYYDCGNLPKNSEIVSDHSTLWNGSEYEIPAGRTTELCHSGDDGCEKSICQWNCRTDYFWVKDDICVSINTTKFIPPNALNQLILPNISRQDVALEPVPGVQSFAPVLKTEIYYSGIWDERVAGWHLDLPRVELNMSNWGVIAPLYEWDQQTVYVYMPWGREEYSAIEKKCFDAENMPISVCSTSSDLAAANHVEITFYPAPGQNLFSYVILETTGEACCKISFTNADGKYFDGDGKGKDTWKVTRYGDDGSVTEFYRGAISTNIIDPILPDPIPIPRDIALNFVEYAPRPASYNFMDYIPISKYTTRDKKVTSFKYDWERVENDKGKFSYYSIKSVNIIDPLKRVIEIASDSSENSLTGNPDFFNISRLYKPLEGKITISVGKVNANPFKKVADYNFGSGFEMEAKIYKDGNIYRTDEYSIDENNADIFHLDSYFTIRNQFSYLWILAGQTTWEFEKSGGYYGRHYPIGYTERKLAKDSSEYLVKTVRGEFHSSTQRTYKDYYKPYSLFFLEDENNFLSTTTIYSHEKNGSSDKKRIVENYFTNWLQPAKKVTCERNDDEKNCDGISNTVTEEIRYNVGGSPIYFKNADNQVTVNLYDTTSEVNSQNYTRHFILNPLGYSNAINLDISLLIPDLIRADNLHKFGTLACSAVYSLDADDNVIDTMLKEYISSGFDHSENWCSNASDRRVTNYEWKREDDELEKPYDLTTVTYPDGKERTLTYDYEITNNGVGKVRGETITGNNNENTLQTCYEYNENYQLVAQGIGTPGPTCNKKKGFAFGGDGGLLMTRDYSFDENLRPVLENNYIYDYLGRKLVERNSAGVSTLYVYDSLDRVVFTFFGCRLDNNNSGVFGQIYEPYDFNGNDFAGEDGRGVTFRSAFPYNDFNCEYYRKYKYDAMSNLVETFFFEYWGVNANNQVVQLDSPKIIKQTTEYDMFGRAVKSCQFDVAQPSDKRCIETEHDAFGNITKKTENGEERIITYDLRNRPLTVTVDGLQTEEYLYSNSASGGYFGHDTISNKYEKTLTTYKDKWGRAAKSVDPFGNNVEPHYNSTTWLTDYSKTYNGTILTSFDAYEYDDLGRISTIKKVLFDPALNTSNAAATSINGIAAKEMVIEKSYSYDSDTGSVVAIEDSFGRETVNTYDHLNRIVKVENYDADNLLVSSERTAYDTTGRISAVQNWTSAKTTVTEYDYDNMGRIIATCVSTTNATETDDCIAASCTFTDTKCSYQLYNTGGQVVWSADTETGGITYLLPFLNIDLIVGNETVYSYNAFGEVVKTARRMTANGSGGGLTETQLYNSDAWITTNFTYDPFGRITEKADDNGAKTHYTYTANNLPGTETYCGSDDPNCASPHEVTYTYNTLRDLVSETYEQNNVSLTVNYGRDDYGRISQKYTGTTATDVYQTFTYNNRNLLETAKSVDPTNTTSTLSEVTRTYDSFGSIKSETFDSGTVSSAIAWNPTTKVMSETITLPSGKNIVETVFSGLPKALEYDGTKLLQYNYGSGNVLSSIHKNFDSNNNHSAELDYTYNNWRKVSRRTEEFTAQNAPTVADYEYTYSKGLHLIGKQENEENRRTAYQYDSYYRLRRVDYDCAYNADDPTCIENRNNVFKCNQSETDCEDFQLDGVHNIRSSYENQTNFAWAVDGFNRLTQKSDGSNTVKYSYDSNNNMIGEDFDGNPNTPPEIVYTYDKLNRLTTVANSDYLVEYSYDPFNRRTEKTVYYADGNDTYEQTHKYAYNDWDIISEEIKTVCTSDNPASTTAWELRRYVDHGTDNHIIMDTVSCSDDGNGNCSPNESTLQRIWFHKDERGNVIAISNGNGTIYERYRYRVYGEHEVLNADFTPKTTAAISPFLWGGSLYEPETNLYWMRNRYYHIDMHRFINQDPIGIWGDANNLGNGFAYVAGMVIEASDPSGLASDANSFAEVYGFNKHDVPTTPMTPEEKMVVGWMRSAIFNIGLGFYFSGPFGLASGIFNTALTIISDLDKTNPNAKFTISLTLLRVGEYYSIIDAFNKATSGKKLLAGFLVDAISIGYDLASLYKNNKDLSDDKLNEDLDSDKLKTLLLDNGDIVIADENGKIVHCSGDCSSTPEGSYLDADLLKTLWGIYPSDPYEDASDMIQNIIRINILTKMLKRGESEQPPFFTDTSTGPNGAIKIYKNPYYVNKDPLKTILLDGDNGSGKPMLYRNPFVPGAEYGYDATTYEKWQQSGFVQPNVDPYFE